MPGDTLSGELLGVGPFSVRIVRAERPVEAAGCPPAGQAGGRVEALFLRAPPPAGP